jgi:hypothetical protein
MRFARPPLLIVALICSAVAAPALAQPTAPVTYPPPCDASKVSKADSDRAHTVFLSGKQYLDESNYDKAISYFNDAYQIDCSVHGILPIIATACERRGDKPEAVRALEEYSRRAPNAADHEVIERRIKNLKDQIAREQPPPPPSATATPTPIPASSAPPEATVAPAAVSVAEPPPAPPPSKSPGAAPWILVGVGGAAVVTGVVLLGIGAKHVSTADGECPDRKCPSSSSSAVDLGNGGRTLEGVGGVLGGVGIAAAAAGLIWHFTAPSTPTQGGARVDPVFAPGYAGVTVGGVL